MSFKPTSVPTKRLPASITSTQMTFKLDDIIGGNGFNANYDGGGCGANGNTGDSYEIFSGNLL